MNVQQYPLSGVTRSLASWFMVGIWTIVWFLPVLFATLVILPFDRDRKNMHPFISIWAKGVMIACPMMRIHFNGAENLERGKAYILVANHQSVADIIAILHLKHSFKFIAKKDLFWIPFMGWALYFAGYIPLVRGNQNSGKGAVMKARSYLMRGASVLLFPEGTRSPDGEIHDFKMGAFKLAAETGVPVVPVVIDGTRDLIPKGSPVFHKRVEVTVKIGKPRILTEKVPVHIESFSNEIRSEMIHSLNEIRGRLPSPSLRGGRQADEAISDSGIASASLGTLPRNDEKRTP